MAGSSGPDLITNGLVLALDAADKNSYLGSGTSWYDLSGNGNTGALTNSPTFNSSNGGSIAFDGTNQCVVVNSNASILSTRFIIAPHCSGVTRMFVAVPSVDL